MAKAVFAFHFNQAGDIALVGRFDRAFRLARTQTEPNLSTSSKESGDAASSGQIDLTRRSNSLMSSKQADFERFARIAQLVSDARHLESRCFEEIVKLAMEMNPSGKRKYIGSEILGSLRSGERIVCATGDRGNS